MYNSIHFHGIEDHISMRYNAFIIGWLLLGLPFDCLRSYTILLLTLILGP